MPSQSTCERRRQMDSEALPRETADPRQYKWQRGREVATGSRLAVATLTNHGNRRITSADGRKPALPECIFFLVAKCIHFLFFQNYFLKLGPF